MEIDSKFLCQKKLLVFGSEGVGKTSLSSILTTYFSALCAYGIYAYNFKGNEFNEEEASTEESK